MKRRMGWQKPTDYAAEMAKRGQEPAAPETPSSPASPAPAGSAGAPESGTRGTQSPQGHHRADSAAVEESDDPAQDQNLQRRRDPRVLVGLVVWSLFVIASLFLAVGALLVALDADPDQGLVGFVLSGADAVDLGIFSRENGLVTFTGEDAETRSALVNWGLGAVAWLIVGRVLDRLLRP